MTGVARAGKVTLSTSLPPPRARVGHVSLAVSSPRPTARVGQVTLRVSQAPRVARVGRVTLSIPTVGKCARLGTVVLTNATGMKVWNGAAWSPQVSPWVRQGTAWARMTPKVRTSGGAWALVPTYQAAVPPTPPTPPDPSPTTTPHLPIAITSTMYTAMKSAARQVYPVGVITFGPNLTQSSRFPPGTNSPAPANGGDIRDNYVFVSTDELTARRAETDWYNAAGFDAYVMDYFATTYNSRMGNLAQAQIDRGGPGVALQPDGNTSATSSTAQAAADICLTLINAKPTGYYRRGSDGRYLVMPFNPEGAGDGVNPPQWWRDFISAMQSGGRPVYVVGCFQSATAGTAASFIDPYVGVFEGVSWWGDASGSQPTTGAKYGGFAAYARSKGFTAYQWARLQDDRPRENKTTDPDGFGTFLKSWALCENADHAFFPTTNDFTEGSGLANSLGSGYGWLDLFTTYSTWFKLGQAAAPIVRDGIYIIHRKQFLSYVGTQSTPFGTVSGTPHNDVSALVFLTASAQVILNGVDKGIIPAGVTHLHSPLTYGQVGAQVKRGSVTVVSVTSPHTVADVGVSNKMSFVTSSFAGRAGSALPY